MDRESLKRILAKYDLLQPAAVSQRTVLRDELRAIAGRRRVLDVPRPTPDIDGTDEEEYLGKAFDAGLLGLAFSGGGIRSATFNLGVLQVLARHRLLRHVDYLSTVSGGGYVGGWLTALIQRTFGGEHAPALSRQQFERLEDELAWSAGDGVADSHDREHRAIRFLRYFSNYLTPKLGVFSGDTWALFAIYLRNVLLNQLVLVSALVCALLVPRVFSYGLRSLEARVWDWPGFMLAAALALYGLWTLGTNLGSVGDGSRSVDTAGVVRRLILPMLGTGLLACVLLPRFVAEFGAGGWLWAMWLGALANGVLWTLAGLCAYVASPKGETSSSASFATAHQKSFWAWAVGTSIPSGALLGALLLWLTQLLDGLPYMGYRVAIVPPALLTALLISAIVHIGLAGNGFDSRHREWLSRLGGLMGIAAMSWAAVSALVFLSPWVQALPGYLDWPLIGSWAAATVSGIYVGKTTSSAAVPSLVKRLVMALAPWVFIGGLLVILAWCVQALLALVPTKIPSMFPDEVVRDVLANESVSAGIAGMRAVGWAEYGAWLAATEHLYLLLTVGVPAGALAVIFSWRVDINSFSLHNMYANRLVRCFLGATNPDRAEDGFTRFSTEDDLTLCATAPSPAANATEGEPSDNDDRAPPGPIVYEHLETWQTVPEERPEGPAVVYPGPYHLVCTAINLAGGDNLAWQERKSGSFVLAPLYCGFELGDRDGERGYGGKSASADRHKQARGEYRPTHLFAAQTKALTLGEAMATSGAAASPNMGYHTTPALAFLMGIFNIRLGRWVGNPRRRGYLDRSWRKTGPRFALLHLLKEVFGMTDDTSSFVYLSDGGHFENLGIYELVRRRCRYVIACDSGADPNYLFEDLGNAIRKCRIDLGVEIELDVRQIARRDEDGFSDAPCAIGKIRYSDEHIGTLLYIKSSRRGGAPSDVVQYWRKRAAFPHESTADQFFSESQFESYRRLGRFLASEILRDAVADTRTENGGNLDLGQLFRALEQNWYGSSKAVSTHFSTLTTQIDNLFERLRTSDELGFLHEQFYPEWQTLLSQDSRMPAKHRPEMWNLPSDETSLRHGFYFCNSLIQLMENVYLDLDLDSEWTHPDNSGWMNVFRHWTWSSMFRITWAISAATYGRRFRAFCRQRLKLELGRIDVVEIQLDVSKALAESLQAGRLNDVECDQLERLAGASDPAALRLFRLDLKVPYMAGDEKAEPTQLLRSFGIGYALLEKHEIVMYRVQDHLRNMGLGQRGLEKLIAKLPAGSRLDVAVDVKTRLRRIGETVDVKWIAEFKALLDALQPIRR